MGVMLLYPNLVCLIGEDQIHRVDRLPTRHTSGTTIPQPYLCLLGARVYGENVDPLETIEPRLHRRRLDGLRVAETVSCNEVGSPKVTRHQIGMTPVEAVDQDSGPRDRSVPPIAHAELHQVAARDFR